VITGTALTDRERAVVEAVPKGLLIGGEWREASSRATFAVEDPSTGEPLCEVADGTPEDGLEALAADQQPLGHRLDDGALAVGQRGAGDHG
jgi:succinate-semialdehyde dehydrogenase/glutarate-semialdehyde dehydrogenase